MIEPILPAERYATAIRKWFARRSWKEAARIAMALPGGPFTRNATRGTPILLACAPCHFLVNAHRFFRDNVPRHSLDALAGSASQLTSPSAISLQAVHMGGEFRSATKILQNQTVSTVID